MIIHLYYHICMYIIPLCFGLQLGGVRTTGKSDVQTAYFRIFFPMSYLPFFSPQTKINQSIHIPLQTKHCLDTDWNGSDLMTLIWSDLSDPSMNLHLTSAAHSGSAFSFASHSLKVPGQSHHHSPNSLSQLSGFLRFLLSISSL